MLGAWRRSELRSPFHRQSALGVVQKGNMKADSHQQILTDGISVRALANWILDSANDLQLPITNMALNKLVYFAVEYSLVRHNRLLANAKIEAWEHGPVFRELYHQFKEFGDRPITDRARSYDPVSDKMVDVDPQVPSEIEGELRDYLTPMLAYPAAKLRAISHVIGGPWHTVWAHDGFANPGMEITPDTILENSSRGLNNDRS